MGTTTDDSTSTRRAFLAAGLGALAASVGSALGRPAPADAADGDAMRVGRDQEAVAVTTLRNRSNTGFVCNVEAATGIIGRSVGSIGVHGQGGSVGVYGASTTGGYGVHGHSPTAYGVHGTSDSNHAVAGLSSTSAGVAGFSDTGQGVIGVSNTVGVLGQSGTGRGGRFSGRKAQVRLVPARSARPSSGQSGDLFVDAGRRLWFCKGGTNWVRLA